MQLQLPAPCKNVAIELLDWMPQRVYEAFNEELTAGMSMDIGGIAEVTDDDILRELGADELQLFKNATDEKKEETRQKVRRRISMKKVQAKFSMKDNNRAQLVKISGMVRKITVTNEGSEPQEMTDKDEIKDALLELPVNCYELISKKVDEIEKSGDDSAKK